MAKSYPKPFIHEILILCLRLIAKSNCFQVETIGDAYMVVCGVPESSADHAVRVADFALGAVIAAKQVKSPATGKTLQVRC